MEKTSRNSSKGFVRDYYAGALMLLIGLVVVTQGIGYDVGTLTEMGPGFFPVALGIILCALGVAIAGTAKSQPDAFRTREKLPPEWRGWLCIVSSIVAFTVIGRYGGLLPATFAIVFISALGDRENTIWRALLLAAGMTVLCVLVFWWALSLQFPLFQWG